jgi:hypothetical protein
MKLSHGVVHLRFPFSFFLLPVFMFGVFLPTAADPMQFLLIGIAMYLFLYPASNAFNSYFDKGIGPIGWKDTILLLTFIGPALIYLIIWMRQVWQDEKKQIICIPCV